MHVQGGLSVEHLPDILEETIRTIAPQLFGPVLPLLPVPSTLISEAVRNAPTNNLPIAMEVGVSQCLSMFFDVPKGTGKLCWYFQESDVETGGLDADNVHGPRTRRAI